MCNSCLCPWQLFAPVGRISSNVTMETASWAADSVMASETVQTDQTRQTVETVSVVCWCECSQTYHLSALSGCGFFILGGNSSTTCKFPFLHLEAHLRYQQCLILKLLWACKCWHFSGVFCNSQPQVVLLVSSKESCHSPDLWQFHLCPNLEDVYSVKKQTPNYLLLILLQCSFRNLWLHLLCNIYSDRWKN